MKWLILLFACIFLPSAGFANSFRVVYDGGAYSGAQNRKEIRLYIDSHQVRIVNKKTVTGSQTSPPAVRGGERNIHQRAGAAIGIGAFEIEICSKTTITPKGEVNRSITIGTSTVKRPLHVLDFQMFWRNPEEANSQSLKSGNIKEEEFPDLIRCPAPV